MRRGQAFGPLGVAAGYSQRAATQRSPEHVDEGPGPGPADLTAPEHERLGSSAGT